MEVLDEPKTVGEVLVEPRTLGGSTGCSRDCGW